MGLFDKVKKTLSGNADKVAEGVDKATDVVDDKTGGKYTDKLDKVDEKAAEALDKLKGDDA